MALVGFKKMFAEKVESGEKKQTIQARLKKSVEVGETLHFFTGSGANLLKFGEKVCKSVQAIEILEDCFYLSGYSSRCQKEAEEMAVAEGFKTWEGLVSFFGISNLPFKGVLIKW